MNSNDEIKVYVERHSRHGDLRISIDDFLRIWTSDDPDLAYVFVDMDSYLDAHPCECEALCECDNE